MTFCQFGSLSKEFIRCSEDFFHLKTCSYDDIIIVLTEAGILPKIVLANTYSICSSHFNYFLKLNEKKRNRLLCLVPSHISTHPEIDHTHSSEVVRHNEKKRKRSKCLYFDDVTTLFRKTGVVLPAGTLEVSMQFSQRPSSPGCLISNISTVESIQLQVIEDSGHILFHQLKQKINEPETDSEDVVVCSTEGCTKTFANNEELTNHLYSEKCTLVFDQKSSCSSDISKVKYLEKVAESSVNKQLMIMPSATKLSTSDSELDMGWALKDDRKNKRFNKNQTDYLYEKFNKGQKSCKKEDPYSVSEAMLLEKNEDGSRRFDYSEILSVQQITSYFSRLCRKLKLDESGSDAAREETISNLTQQINSNN